MASEDVYENIGRNRVSTYVTRDQNHFLVPRYESRYMKDSVSYTGASLWNFVIYNDKEASVTLNFNQLRKRVSSEDYFIDFKFECTSASAIRCRQHSLYIIDHCVHLTFKFVNLF